MEIIRKGLRAMALSGAEKVPHRKQCRHCKKYNDYDISTNVQIDIADWKAAHDNLGDIALMLQGMAELIQAFRFDMNLAEAPEVPHLGQKAVDEVLPLVIEEQRRK